MTTYTDHGLICLDGDDYGAVALAMQEDAIRLDETLTEINTSINGYRNRTWWNAVNTSSITINNASGFEMPEGFIGEDSPNSGSWSITANGTAATSAFKILPTGWYHMGATVNWTVATPNNNTRRTLLLWNTLFVNGQGSDTVTYDRLYLRNTGEQSTGGGSMHVSGFFHSDGVTPQYIVSGLSHLNTSSDLVVAAGNWRTWFTFMGSGLVI